MEIFYKVSDKQLLKDRNDLFKEVGVPALEKNGYIKSPFKTSWFGEYDRNISGYSYELCRLINQNHLQIITVSVVKGDKWIKIYLNIFELHKKLNSISELEGYDGIKFHLPPNNLTKMRLRSDDYKGPPLFYMLFLPEHKIGGYKTQSGFEKEVKKLRGLIQKDMTNIDFFVNRWHELHKPNVTDWEGNKVE